MGEHDRRPSGPPGSGKETTLLHPSMHDADRVATAIATFESRSGLTWREFEERYAGGEFRGATWALAWHGITAIAAGARPAS